MHQLSAPDDVAVLGMAHQEGRRAFLRIRLPQIGQRCLNVMCHGEGPLQFRSRLGGRSPSRGSSFSSETYQKSRRCRGSPQSIFRAQS